MKGDDEIVSNARRCLTCRYADCKRQHEGQIKSLPGNRRENERRSSVRLTKKKPDENFEAVLNLFYCKDMTTWVRGGGSAPEYRDVKLDDWIRGVVKRFNADINVDEMNDEELNMQMAELMIGEEMETIEDFIALFYNAAWAFSALNARLMEYEDTGLSPEEIAEMKGRIAGALSES